MSSLNFFKTMLDLKRMEYCYRPFVLFCCLFFITVMDAMLITDQCKQVETIDCLNSYKPEGNETVCCSDLKVYDNLCFFAQQKCKDPTLTVLYPGHCNFVTPPTVIRNTTDEIVTVNQNPVTDIPTDPILEAFCDHKDEITCSDELDPICGTDNKFYRNNCEFVKARCVDKDLGTQTLTVSDTIVAPRIRIALTDTGETESSKTIQRPDPSQQQKPEGVTALERSLAAVINRLPTVNMVL